MRPDELVPRLIKSGVAKPANIKGCSENQIAEVEKKHGVVLPRAYRQFLLLAGNGAGRLMDDVAVFYSDVFDLTELIRREINPELPAHAFVIAERMGDYLFIIAD